MKPVTIICDSFKQKDFVKKLNNLNIKFKIQTISPDVRMFTCESTKEAIKPIIDELTQFYNELKKQGKLTEYVTTQKE